MTTIDEIRETVAEVLEVEPSTLQPDTKFTDLPNFDSVVILSMIIALDDLGVDIPQQKASEICTFQDVLVLANLSE